jgi:hypothetical protein
MRRFRLRRLWRVNCEALVTASGQNLKRLLRKRGWGRRPFPAEAVALTPPPHWGPDEAPRYRLLKSGRPSIAVASFVAREVSKAFFEPQGSQFFSVNHQLYLFCIVYKFENPTFKSHCLIAILLFYPFLENLGRSKLISSAGTFSTGWTVL